LSLHDALPISAVGAGSSAPVRAVLRVAELGIAELGVTDLRVAELRVAGRNAAVLLPQLLLLPQERILLLDAVVRDDAALALRTVRPAGLPGQRVMALAAVELLVRGRGLAALRLGRAAELLIGRRGLPLGDRTGPAVRRVGGRRGAIRCVTGQRVLVHGAGGAAAVPRCRAGGVLAQRADVGISLGAGPPARAVP